MRSAAILVLLLVGCSPHAERADEKGREAREIQSSLLANPEPGSCEWKWRSIPPSFRGDVLYEDFQEKCRGGGYIALCEAGDLSFADTNRDLCPGSRVLEYRQVPDA